jgi:hypothetical protein
MRKGIGTVIFNGTNNTLISFSVMPVSEPINIIDFTNCFHTCNTFDNFHNLYATVLKVAKNNGFYFKNWISFDAKWYCIQFIDISANNISPLYYPIKEK